MVDVPPEIETTTPDAPASRDAWLAVFGIKDLPPVAPDPARIDEPPRTASVAPKADDVLVEQVADMAANRQLREKYADAARQLATGSLVAWFLMLASQGIIKAVTDKEMWSDKVLIAVTTGVTVSVMTAFLGVIRGLFPNGANGGSVSVPKKKRTR